MTRVFKCNSVSSTLGVVIPVSVRHDLNIIVGDEIEFIKDNSNGKYFILHNKNPKNFKGCKLCGKEGKEPVCDNCISNLSKKKKEAKR